MNCSPIFSQQTASTWKPLCFWCITEHNLTAEALVAKAPVLAEALSFVLTFSSFCPGVLAEQTRARLAEWHVSDELRNRGARESFPEVTMKVLCCQQEPLRGSCFDLLVVGNQTKPQTLVCFPCRNLWLAMWSGDTNQQNTVWVGIPQ